MSIVSNPLIGRTSKSMGNVTFSSWKGINVLKNKATSVANPRSGAQLAQRAAFTQMVALFRGWPAAVRAGFKKLAVKKSEFNAFATANLDEAWDVSAPPAATLDPGAILISKGTIGITAMTTFTADRSIGTIEVAYPATISLPGQSLTDVPIVAAYNITTGETTGQPTADLRSDGSTTIPLPLSWSTGDDIQVYLAFYNPLSGESSDSVNDDGAIVA